MDELKTRIDQLEQWKREKDSQQLSYPIDDNTRKILQDLLSTNSFLTSSSLSPYLAIANIGNYTTLDFGDGADGAFSASSGTTTLDTSGAAVLVKNYTTIDITGSADLTLSNVNNYGCILVLKSQGNVTITSSANPAIQLQAMGALYGASQSGGADGQDGTESHGNPFLITSGLGSTVTGPTSSGGTGGSTPLNGFGYGALYRSMFMVAPGSGGGSGGNPGTNNGGGGGGGGASLFNIGATGSAATNHSNPQPNGSSGRGGRGGGALIILCGGNLNVTSNIGLSGQDGAAASGTGANGGGGGGGGGTGLFVYAGTLTAFSGTVNVSGGAGGAKSGNGGNGAAGGDGDYLVSPFYV